jgi:hypothetical protein
MDIKAKLEDAGHFYRDTTASIDALRAKIKAATVTMPSRPPPAAGARRNSAPAVTSPLREANPFFADTLEEESSTDVPEPVVEPASSRPASVPVTAAAPVAGPGNSALDTAIAQFEEHYMQLLKKTHKNQNGFEQEFSLLKLEDEQKFDESMCSVGFKNRDKNRYKDILPIDSARVLLSVLEPGANDYINASYLPVHIKIINKHKVKK